MAGLAEGADGRIYGTTRNGGVFQNGTIFRLKKDGSSYCVFHPFPADVSSFDNKAGLFQGTDGSLYATVGGDLNFGFVYRLAFPANLSPTLAHPIADQNGTYGSPFNFTFVANTFGDPDAGQSLSYGVSGLPAGIIFDGPSRTFSGTPTAIGTNSVLVTATDNGTPTLNTNDTFRIVVNQAPLAISANNTNRPYGGANPIFTGTLVGVTNSDNLTVTFTTVATPGSPPGDYLITPILQDPNARLGNYSVITNNGMLSVLGVTLEFNAAAGSPTLCWPTAAAAFLLEYTDDLAPPVIWHETTSGMTTNGPNICLAVAPEATVPSRFYRLRLP